VTIEVTEEAERSTTDLVIAWPVVFGGFGDTSNFRIEHIMLWAAGLSDFSSYVLTACECGVPRATRLKGSRVIGFDVAPVLQAFAGLWNPARLPELLHRSESVPLR
jgi:hypothetical protein